MLSYSWSFQVKKYLRHFFIITDVVDISWRCLKWFRRFCIIKYCLRLADGNNQTKCNLNQKNVIYFITSTAYCTATRHNQLPLSGILCNSIFINTDNTYKRFNASVMVTAVSTAFSSLACLHRLCSLEVLHDKHWQITFSEHIWKILHHPADVQMALI